MNLKISYSKEADKFLKKNEDNLKEEQVDGLKSKQSESCLKQKKRILI
jgi:hypothetical protein